MNEKMCWFLLAINLYYQLTMFLLLLWQAWALKAANLREVGLLPANFREERRRVSKASFYVQLPAEVTFE